MKTSKPRTRRAKTDAPSAAEIMAVLKEIADRQDAIKNVFHAMALEIVKLAVSTPVFTDALKDTMRATAELREKVALLTAAAPTRLN